jgi:conserved hypothetical protein, YceG family
MKKFALIILSIFFVIALSVAYVGYRAFFASNTQGETTYIFIHNGEGYDSLIESLEKSGSILDMRSFKLVASAEKLEESIKPGRYKISPGMNNRLLARTFKLGWQTPVNLTISGNIRDMEKLASIVSSKIASDSLSVVRALTDETLIDSLGFNSYSFPSIFLLNTYEVYWTISSADLVRRFKKEFDTFWDQKRLQRAEEIGLTPIEVSTLASIVAEESNIKAEHPVIAGVYINRLKIGMLLQADPTVKFAHKDPSIRRILYKHLEIDSPYNTYMYAGLPPGPIVLPSPEVIDSVLYHTEHKYLYFCAKATLDGSHNFAVTLEEHNRNAQQYQRAIGRL